MSEQDKHQARIFLHRGDIPQARACWESAVADDRAAGNTAALSDSLGNLGNACALAGDFSTAEQCYREVLSIQRTEQDMHAVAHTLVNLGNLHVGAGAPGKAHAYYLEALDILGPLADHRALGILYHNLALEEARRQQWDAAIARFKQALEEHRMVGNEEGLAVTYSQLGKAFLDSGRMVEAER
ncbi:MAG TPA: tetratricopeptide repeat protein, partial [Nitrospiraceae bacterium]|nr:tetratricopeptide repeat protein [Nitrospiraceae bacterium]